MPPPTSTDSGDTPHTVAAVRRREKYTFVATLLRPAQPGGDTAWAFVLLPKEASAVLPRRGRTVIDGTINGHLPMRG
ncbi:MAG: DUF1905 domain-containing protein [Rhodanobacteraceae bacterium]|nr:DUF1905 domain-containing protein [Rhodanobacteraceae bacterium]